MKRTQTAMPDPSSIIIGAVSLLLGAMISPISSDLYRKAKGADYATKKDCQIKHDQMQKDCTACKASTNASICAIRHEGDKNRKLLLLIAIRLRIPTDELKDYM